MPSASTAAEWEPEVWLPAETRVMTGGGTMEAKAETRVSWRTDFIMPWPSCGEERGGLERATGHVEGARRPTEPLAARPEQ